MLELVADGRSNDEIATSLYLSTRTIERHLSNIYAKLRISGKAARAAAAASFSRAQARRPTHSGPRYGHAPEDPPIPERTRHDVWRRDQGRRVDCESRDKLEFHHIIPVGAVARTQLGISNFGASGPSGAKGATGPPGPTAPGPRVSAAGSS